MLGIYDNKLLLTTFTALISTIIRNKFINYQLILL